MAVSPLQFKQLIDFLSNYIAVQPDEVLAIGSILRYGSFNKNTLLIEQNKVTDMLGLILKGYARGYYFDAKGRELTCHFDWEFDILLAPRSFFGQKPAEYNVIAMERLDLVYTTYGDLISFFKKHPRFEGIVKDLVRDNMPDINEHTKLLQMISAQERYEYFMATRPDIIKRVPQKHIATYLGMNTETLSRVRGKMS